MQEAELETLLQAGEYELVLEQAERIYSGRGDRQRDNQTGLTCLYACKAEFTRRRWRLALVWADRGLNANPDQAAEGRLRFAAAAALMYIGDLLRAERELERFRLLANRSAALRKQMPDADYNLGFVKRMLHRPAEAIGLFQQAGQAYEAAGRANRVILCEYEIAWSFLLDGNPEAARPHLDAAEAGLARWPDPETSVDVSTAAALYHSLRGECEKSDRLCLELLSQGDLPPRQSADLFWLLGSNAIGAHNLEAAVEYLEQAHEAATQDWWPPQMERINALRERIKQRGVPVR